MWVWVQQSSSCHFLKSSRGLGREDLWLPKARLKARESWLSVTAVLDDSKQISGSL